MTILALSILLTLNLFVGLHGNDVRESTNIETPDILNQEENMDVRVADYEDYVEEAVGGMMIDTVSLSPRDMLAEDAKRARKPPPAKIFMLHFENQGSLLLNFLAFLGAVVELTFLLVIYTFVIILGMEYINDFYIR